MCEVCRTTGAGVLGSVAARRAQAEHDRKIREETIRAMTGGKPAGGDHSARDFLIVCGAIFFFGSGLAVWAADVLKVAILAAPILAVLAAAGWIGSRARRRRRLRTVVPAPLPCAPPRTAVTSVRVRALGMTRRESLGQAAPARVRSRSAGPR